MDTVYRLSRREAKPLMGRPNVLSYSKPRTLTFGINLGIPTPCVIKLLLAVFTFEKERELVPKVKLFCFSVLVTGVVTVVKPQNKPPANNRSMEPFVSETVVLTEYRQLVDRATAPSGIFAFATAVLNGFLITAQWAAADIVHFL
jgi:hypothetical protein